MASLTRASRSFVADFDVTEPIDTSKRLFIRFPRAKPTLEEALSDANVQNRESILRASKGLADRAREDPEIAKLGLSDDEACAIACYTLEAEDGRSPYRVINEGLAGSRDRDGLSSIKKLMYLFLSGLRKLPRFRPSAGQRLHRGMRAKVPTSKDEANGHQFYERGEQ